MTREVSRRTSIPPEQKGKVVRPDMPGKRDLDPKQVRDVPDPWVLPTPAMIEINKQIERVQREINELTGIDKKAIRRGRDMDHYVGSINPTEGLSKSTGYVDNNNGPEPRGGKNAKRK
jgi:hypothetical protein